MNAEAKKRVMVGRPKDFMEYVRVLNTLKGEERQFAKAVNFGFIYSSPSPLQGLKVRDLITRRDAS